MLDKLNSVPDPLESIQGRVKQAVLALLAPALPVRSLRNADVGHVLHRARMCSTHLAGDLGVSFSQALVEKHILEEASDSYCLTETGADGRCNVSMDAVVLRKQKHIVVSAHSDWSLQCHFVAGALGMACTSRLLELAWMTRVSFSRARHLTQSSRQQLSAGVGLSLDGARPHSLR